MTHLWKVVPLGSNQLLDVSKENINMFWKQYEKEFPNTYKTRLEESFSINLIDYEATRYVDSIDWGKQHED